MLSTISYYVLFGYCCCVQVCGVFLVYSAILKRRALLAARNLQALQWGMALRIQRTWRATRAKTIILVLKVRRSVIHATIFRVVLLNLIHAAVSKAKHSALLTTLV